MPVCLIISQLLSPLGKSGFTKAVEVREYFDENSFNLCAFQKIGHDSKSNYEERTRKEVKGGVLVSYIFEEKRKGPQQCEKLKMQQTKELNYRINNRMEFQLFK